MPNPARLTRRDQARCLRAPRSVVLWLLCIGLLPQPLWAAGNEPASSAPAPASSAPAPSAPAPSAPTSQPAAQTPSAAPAAPESSTASAPRAFNANSEVARARQLFQERKFAEAAQALQRAYAFEPNPLFLFNAGQAYRKAEQRKEALEMYQRYLEVDERGPLAPEARGYVSDLQAMLKAQERLQDAQIELETKESQAKKTQAALKIETDRALFMEQALKNERTKPFYKKPWFYGLLGATVVAIGAGLITIFVIRDRESVDSSLQPTFP